MRPHKRSRTLGRRSWLLASLALCLPCARAAESISISYDGENLRPVAAGVHFLSGSSLDRMKDGEAVTYSSWLSLYTLNRSDPLRLRSDRFVISYDIWEQKFKVTIPGPAPRSKTGLTGPQAESWCLENMAISASGLATDTPFFLRLELRAPKPKESSAAAADSGSGISILKSLPELFGRKAEPGEPHWGPYESARQRLSDLIRTTGRGAGNG